MCRPGARPAEALTEDELSGEDLVQVRVLLPVAAVHAQQRGEQAHPEAAEDRRRAGAGQLFLVDRLHHWRGAPAASLLGPGEGQPAALVETPLPLALDVLVLLLPVAAHATVAPLHWEVGLEPGLDLGSKCLLFRRVAQVHGCEASTFGKRRSDGFPRGVRGLRRPARRTCPR